MSDFFLDGNNKKQKELFNSVIDLGFDFINGETRKNKVVNYKNSEFLKAKFSEPIPKNGICYDAVLKLIEEIGEYSISQSDLNYLAFPDSGNSIHALLADIYSKFINQNLISFDRGAPVATLIEIQLIEWLREYVGYDHKVLKKVNSLSEVSGMWTTGGHMSNHIAIMTALNHKYSIVKKKGLKALAFSPKIILAGKISHYSISSAMHHLGLGSENIIDIASNPDFTTSTIDLERVLKQHKKDGDVFMVVGVAGNTRTSSIDNLKKIGDLCKKYGVWFHIDACHGGSLLLSKKLKRKHLDGIEEGDSVSLDPHKGMFVAYPCSYVIFKKRDSLMKFNRYEDKTQKVESWNLGYITPFFGSRGFESFKLWMLIKGLGKIELEKIVEERDRNAHYVFAKIKKSKLFVLFHEISFYRMCFVFLPEKINKIIEDRGSLTQRCLSKLKDCVDNYTHRINQELYEEGLICVDEFKLHDIGDVTHLNAGNDSFFVIGVVTGNPLHTRESLDKSLDVLFKKADSFLLQMEIDILNILDNGTYQEKTDKTSGPAGWI